MNYESILLFSVLLLFSTTVLTSFPMAFADNIQDSITDGTTVTIVDGSTLTNYFTTSSSNTGNNDPAGCNIPLPDAFGVNHPLTLYITTTPPGIVSVSPNPVVLTDCTTKYPVTFTALQGGTTQVSVQGITPVTGGGWQFIDVDGYTYSINPNFTIVVPDTTPPVIVPTITPVSPIGNNGWYVSDVTVSWSVTDPESSITSSSGCTLTTISTDTAGSTFTCTATSAGGTSSQPVTIKRDATAPTITASRDRPANSFGWYNAAVTVSFATSDLLSGIDPARDPADVLFALEGENQSTGVITVYDRANNFASVTESNIDIDLTKPTVTPPPNVTAAATSSSGATVQYGAPTATDNLSGVVSITSSPGTPNTNILWPIKSNKVTHTATDAGGNVGTAESEIIVFDVRIDNLGTISQGSEIYVTILDESRDTSSTIKETVNFHIRSAAGDAAARAGFDVSAIALEETNDPFAFTFTNPFGALVVTNDPTVTTAGAAKLNLGNDGYDTIYVKYTSTDGVTFKEVSAPTQLAGGGGPPATPTNQLIWSSDRFLVDSTGTVKIYESTKKGNSITAETITTASGQGVATSTASTTFHPITLTESGDTGVFVSPGITFSSTLASSFTATTKILNAPAGSTVTAKYDPIGTPTLITVTAAIDPITIPVVGQITVTTTGAVCTNFGGDTDNDGICNNWESATGLNINQFSSAPYTYACRPQIDDTTTSLNTGRYSLHSATATTATSTTSNGCPTTTMRDIYVEWDYMTGHKPSRVAIAKVIDTLSTAPDPDGTGPIVAGIKLHVQLDESYGFHRDTIPWLSDPSPSIQGFQELKTQYFGKNTGERVQAGKSASFISDYLSNKRQIFHYGSSLHLLADGGCSSGRGEQGGNDYVTTLGCFTGNVASDDEFAGTFMHELGHNLNLGHGGPPLDYTDDPTTATVGDSISINGKPNYLSVMNYAFQFKDPVTTRPLDFSRSALPTLNEATGLSETLGIGLPPVSPANLSQGATTWKSVYGPVTGTAPFTAPIVTGFLSASPNPIDWNRSGGTPSGTATVLAVHYMPSIGATDSTLRPLVGYNDYASLDFNPRDSSFFSDGLSGFLTENSVGTATFSNDYHDTPFVKQITAPTAAFNTGVTKSVTGLLEDPDGIGESFTALWNWGDGTTSSGHVGSPIIPAGAATGDETRDATIGVVAADSHSYSSGGKYELKLTVSDNATPIHSSDPALFPAYMMVVDTANRNRISSSSTFTSPVGAYRSPTGDNDSSSGIVGPGKFTFSAQYKSGIPSATGSFTLTSGGIKVLDFKVSTIDWITVTTPTSAGIKAATGTYQSDAKGTGTILGKTGTFGYAFSLLDGNPLGGNGLDKVRVRIYDPLIGDEYNVNAIIYDNMCPNPDDNLETSSTSCVKLYNPATTTLTSGTVTIQ